MVNILIVEDDSLLRDLLKLYLDSQVDLNVVGAVADGESAIEYANRLNPDVVLMDIELGNEPNGIAAGKTIKEAHEHMGMIILSSHKERKYLDLIAADELTGWSYLLKQSVSDVGILVRAIEGAASGLVVMDPLVVNGMKPQKGSRTAGLTPRQQDVLALIAQGYNNSAIAENLDVGIRTVENHINAIYEELAISHDGRLHLRVQAVLRYITDSA